MANRSMLEKLALPMFVAGVIAMLASAGITVSNSAVASSPVEYKKVTLTYLSSGYSAMDSNCGSASDMYSNSWNTPSFRARSLNSNSQDKLMLCTATIYVVTSVSLPTPTPAPTVTVIYRPAPTPAPTFTQKPTPRPTPRPTYSPAPMPTWWPSPTPTPIKRPHG